MNRELEIGLVRCATGLQIHGMSYAAINDALTEITRLEAANTELVKAARHLLWLHDLGKMRTTSLEREEAWDKFRVALAHAQPLKND